MSPHPDHLPRFALSVYWSLVSIGIVLSAVLLAAPSRSRTQWLLFMAALVIAMFGLTTTIVPRFRPVEFTFYLFNLCWILIPLSSQLATGVAAWGDTFIFSDNDLINAALLLEDGALAVFVAGALTSRARRSGAARQAATSSTDPRRSRLRLRVPVMYLIGASVLAPIAIQSLGGVGALFSPRESLNDALVDAGVASGAAGNALVGVLRLLPGSLSLAAALLLICLLRGGAAKSTTLSDSNSRLISGVALCIALAGCVLFLNPLANSRFVSLSALIALTVAALRPRSAFAGVLSGALGLFALLIVYPLANVFRLANSSFAITQALQRGLTGPDFDGFQQMMNAILYVREEGFSYGLHILSAIFYFVPRSIWQNKATPASIDVASNRGYSFTNLSLPLPAELYVDLGLIGLLAIFALGWVASRSDDAWLRITVSPVASVLVPYFAAAVFGLIRGPLGSLAPIYLTTFVLLGLGVLLRTTNGERASMENVGWPIRG